MKTIFTLLAIILATHSFAQIEGTWRLAPEPGAFSVGPNQGDGSWYSSSMNDVTTRACFFDDSITFGAGGTMTHYMDGATWREGWQGVPSDGCGAPVAPHDGTTNAPYTYSFNSVTGELTVNGIGAHVGLAKVFNNGELGSPSAAPSSITYLTSFSSNTDTMNVDINYGGVGGGWWHFTYVRSNIWNLANPNVTFRVDMSNYSGTIATGVFVNGSYNGWCGSCNPMANLGNGIWEVTLPIPAGQIEYKFTVDGWTDEEIFTGTESCIDPIQDANYNRYLSFTGDVTLPTVCFESCTPCLTVSPELIGTWKLKGAAGSLAVGPNQGDGSWWSNQAADVVTRACLFDDSIKFEANGVMTHYMDGSTWLEQLWQGVAQDECGAPVAPHTGGSYTYSYNNVTGELTTIGLGAHIGLPKAYNGGELPNGSAPASITYITALSNNNNTLTADINIGGGWWRFVYEKTEQIIVADPNITFRVDMSEYTAAINNGVYLNGSFNTWCGACAPMTNIGNNIYELTVALPTGPIEYLFTVDEWTDIEAFDVTASCIDPVVDQYNNRYLVVSTDATLPAVCFNSCEVCPSAAGLQDLSSVELNVYPNPSEDNVVITSNEIIEFVELFNMNGELIKSYRVESKEALINVSGLSSGTYILNCVNNGEISRKLLFKN
ncbi:MAG: T9SS type A sorting domain-containing protein [Flavobacteriia bacterium]|jgi:hypothetical protein